MFKYRNIRIGVMAFAFGLASVWLSDAYTLSVEESAIRLPETQSGTILIRPVGSVMVAPTTIIVKLENGSCITIPVSSAQVPE